MDQVNFAYYENLNSLLQPTAPADYAAVDKARF